MITQYQLLFADGDLVLNFCLNISFARAITLEISKVREYSGREIRLLLCHFLEPLRLQFVKVCQVLSNQSWVYQTFSLWFNYGISSELG